MDPFTQGYARYIGSEKYHGRTAEIVIIEKKGQSDSLYRGLVYVRGLKGEYAMYHEKAKDLSSLEISLRGIDDTLVEAAIVRAKLGSAFDESARLAA